MIKRIASALLLALLCSAQTNVPVTVVPAIHMSPASLSFSSPVGGSSAPQTVTATNVGPVAVGIAISLTGSDAGDFSQTNDCPATFEPDATCHINVTFTPAATR